MKLQSQKERLAQKALLFKKAWLLIAVMRGHHPKGEEATIYNYHIWVKNKLEKYVADLEGDLKSALALFISDTKNAINSKSVTWLSSCFDEWVKSGCGLFTISTLQEFEQNVGRLKIHKHMDVPPYAEMLLQPGSDMAFRHPEYMLSRDLDFLYKLYCDNELAVQSVDWSRRPKWAESASEGVQTLARTSILACFNLLESFVSGLAHTYIMNMPKLDEGIKQKLLDTRSPLKSRIISIPKIIAGDSARLDINKPPFSDLFGYIKQHRDSFVHCEPGNLSSGRGYVKETLFHNVSPELVKDAISATDSAIRQVWLIVHRKPGPSWLPNLSSNAEVDKDRLMLAPPEL